jgi:hypothetical protein
MHCSVQYYKTTSYQFDATAAQIRETGPTAPVDQAAGGRLQAGLDAAKSAFFFVLQGIEMWSLCRPFRNAVTVPNMLFGPLKMLHHYF